MLIVSLWSSHVSKVAPRTDKVQLVLVLSSDGHGIICIPQVENTLLGVGGYFCYEHEG